eukprot:5642526-Amphidinium_carterae.1
MLRKAIEQAKLRNSELTAKQDAVEARIRQLEESRCAREVSSALNEESQRDTRVQDTSSSKHKQVAETTSGPSSQGVASLEVLQARNQLINVSLEVDRCLQDVLNRRAHLGVLALHGDAALMR